MTNANYFMAKLSDDDMVKASIELYAPTDQPDIPKEQMKTYLNGQSCDLMDAFMMLEFFDLEPKQEFYVG